MRISDWSSDVFSSDLIDLLSGGVSVGFEPWQDVHYLGVTFAVFLVSREHLSVCGRREVCVPLAGQERHLAHGEPLVLVNLEAGLCVLHELVEKAKEIGRESRRESVCQYV